MVANGSAFQKTFNISIGALFGLALLSAAILHGRLVLSLDRDGENFPPEGAALYSLRCAQTGQAVYRDYHTPPYVLTEYMPLFYFVPGYLCRWLRTEGVGSFIIGRGYVYAFWLGIAVGIYALSKQAGTARSFAVLAALLWLSGPISPQWANSFRPDSAALFLSLAAVWLYLRDQSPGHLTVGIAMLVLAFLHKQTVIAPLLVILMEECRQKRIRRAFVVAFGWGAAVAISVAVAQLLTGGAFVMNVSGFVWPFTVWPAPLYLLIASLLMSGAVFLAGTWACVTIARPASVSLLKRYFIVAFALAILRTTTPGGSQNHYLEPYAVACVLTAVLMQNWHDSHALFWGRLARMGWLGVAMAGSAYILSIRALQIPALISESIHHRSLRDREARDWGVLLARVATLPDPLLIEDNYLDLRRGRTPFMLKASLYALLQSHGRFDDADLRRKISAGEFGAIITKNPLETALPERYFPTQWIEIILHKYRLADRVPLTSLDATYYIYRPIK